MKAAAHSPPMKAAAHESVKRVYYYSWPFAVQMRGVVHATDMAVVIANQGISGEFVARTQLDTLGQKYFSTPEGAIDAEIASAMCEIADPITPKGRLKVLRWCLEVYREQRKALPREMSRKEAETLVERRRAARRKVR